MIFSKYRMFILEKETSKNVHRYVQRVCFCAIEITADFDGQFRGTMEQDIQGFMGDGDGTLRSSLVDVPACLPQPGEELRGSPKGHASGEPQCAAGASGWTKGATEHAGSGKKTAHR
ncbi:hypothetical protein B2K_06050 [Paenibacillus mucilaginosus K02]|uniref:Uncharacterized protein n=3 Tax=Paenibacillus mucilaginosus TaxID=61624 RepID=I0BD42_9BACL|nr:hypothetical protein B2K_06050 [Paenibacillus mucilaginosus K02]